MEVGESNQIIRPPIGNFGEISESHKDVKEKVLFELNVTSVEIERVSFDFLFVDFSNYQSVLSELSNFYCQGLIITIFVNQDTYFLNNLTISPFISAKYRCIN